MRIDGQIRTSIAGRGSQPKGAGAAGFTLGNAAPSQASASTSQAFGPVDIGALLALQGVDDPLFARKKAVRRGRSMLDALEEMRADLLGGRIGESRINALLALVGQAREHSDPELDGLLDDIELRARVELAKIGRFPGF